MEKRQRQMGREGEKAALLLSSPSSSSLLPSACSCMFAWVSWPSPFEDNSYCKPASQKEGGFCCVLLLLWKQKHVYCVKHSGLTLAV